MQRWHLASVNSCNAKKLWRNVINANVSTNVYKKGLSLGGRVLIATAQSANSTTPGKQVKHAIVLSARPNDRWRFSMQVNNIQTMPTNIATNVHMGTWLSNMWKREFSCWNLMKPTASNCAQLFKPPSQQHIRRAACFGSNCFRICGSHPHPALKVQQKGNPSNAKRCLHMHPEQSSKGISIVWC